MTTATMPQQSFDPQAFVRDQQKKLETFQKLADKRSKILVRKTEIDQELGSIDQQVTIILGHNPFALQQDGNGKGQSMRPDQAVHTEIGPLKEWLRRIVIQHGPQTVSGFAKILREMNYKTKAKDLNGVVSQCLKVDNGRTFRVDGKKKKHGNAYRLKDNAAKNAPMLTSQNQAAPAVSAPAPAQQVAPAPQQMPVSSQPQAAAHAPAAE
jgi:hypothetical protein